MTWRRGEPLWEAGAPAEALLSVCTGALGLRSAAGALVDLAVRGELVGVETGVGGAHTHACVGVVTGKARWLDRRGLTSALASRAEGALTLLASSCARQRALTARVDGGDVAARLTAVLRDLGGRVGLRDARGTFVPLRLTRRDLAELVGCREETLVRVLGRLRAEGLVQMSREGIVFADALGAPEPPHDARPPMSRRRAVT